NVAGGGVYDNNAALSTFINDTIASNQATAVGAVGPGGQGTGTGSNGSAGTAGTGFGGGYFAANGSDHVGNTIIGLNTAANLGTGNAGADVGGGIFFTSLGNNYLTSDASFNGFTQSTHDQVVSPSQLNLGPLQNNG